jgi:hypothetical protein
VAGAGFQQLLFTAGVAPSKHWWVPKVSTGVLSLYPLIAVNPGGKTYVASSEIISNWSSVSVLAYRNVGLFKLEGDTLVKVFSDNVTNPNGTTRRAFASDMSVGPDGSMYLLYQKKQVNDPICSYIVKVGLDGTVSSPVAAGCHDLYAQIQVTSGNEINIIEGSGLKIRVSRSGDGGTTWKDYLLNVPGLMNNTKGLRNLTLIKPWNSPKGYDPDVAYGLVGGSFSETATTARYTRRVEIFLRNSALPAPVSATGCAAPEGEFREAVEEDGGDA